MSGFLTPTTPNQTDYTTFLRGHVGIGPDPLPDDSMWITTTLAIAQDVVNDQLNQVQPIIYTLAVYNYAADRLINFAIDVGGLTYFRDLRSQLGINVFAAGVVASSSDQGTSQSLEVLRSMKGLTIGQMQMMKTIYGRQYLDFAQAYGPSPWGLT